MKKILLQNGGTDVVNGKNSEAICEKTIGIPRALSYYLDGFNWQDFFEILGFKVEYSKDSSVKTFQDGDKYVGSEQCFPVKMYYGHVISLLKTTKYIFIPQHISSKASTFCCPKVIGIAQLIKNTIPYDFNLITVKIDLGNMDFTNRQVLKLAMQLTCNPIKTMKALRYFLNNNEKLSKIRDFKLEKNTKSIAVVGHKYALNDKVLNMGIIERLSQYGFDVVTSQGYEELSIMDESLTYFDYSKTHWDFGHALLYSVNEMLRDDKVKGIIFITFFGCGIDAFIEEIFKENVSIKKPYLSLTIDEHSGEAGVMTRIEAFLDMIIRKEGGKQCSIK